MNVIFTLHLNEYGLLELRTAHLNDRGGANFTKLREMIHSAKRIVISTKTGSSKTFSNETSLCFTIDETYEPGPIEGSLDLELKQ